MQNLNQYFPEFLESLQGQSPNNRRNYTLRLQDFLVRYGHKPITELTRADVNDWLRELHDRGYVEATRAGYQQALKRFLSDAAAAANIRSPADHISVERFITKGVKAPPEADVQAALQVAWRWLWRPFQDDLPDSDELRYILDAAVYILSLETGARRGELVALRRSNVVETLRNPDENGVFIVSSYGKRKEVDLEFTDVAAVALYRWLQYRPSVRVDRLFTVTKRSRTKNDRTLRYRPLTNRSIMDCFYRICEEARIPSHTSHPLRHRLGHIITRDHDPKLAGIKLNHADAETTAATAIAYYYRPRNDEASRITVTMRPNVSTVNLFDFPIPHILEISERD